MTLPNAHAGMADLALEQLASGWLTVHPREKSVGLAGVGPTLQAAPTPVRVRATRRPVAAFMLGGGGGETEILGRRYGVRASDLGPVRVARGNAVAFERDATPGAHERGVVESVDEHAGGAWLVLTVRVDRGSADRA